MTQSDPSEHFQTALQPVLLQAFNELPSACFITEASGRIVWANLACCHLTGYRLDELAGRTPALLNAGMEGPAFYDQLWQQVLAGRVWHGRVVDKRKDGSFYVADEAITPLRAADGSVAYLVAVQQDVSALAAGDSGQHPPHPLSGLQWQPNRTSFVARLDDLITAEDRTTGLLGVLRIEAGCEHEPGAPDEQDDHRGHAAIAQRFRHVIRRADMLAQLGPHDFAMLLNDVKDEKNVVQIVGRLERTLGTPFLLRGRLAALRGNIGVALFPRDGGAADALLANAGHALYQASLQGANRAQFYQRSFAHRIADSLPPTHTVQ